MVYRFISIDTGPDGINRRTYLTQDDAIKIYSMQYPPFGVFRQWVEISTEEMSSRIQKLNDSGYMLIHRRGG